VNIEIRSSSEDELPCIREIILASFDESEREDVAELVRRLMADPTAKPLLSLVAEAADGTLVGQVLFSSATVDGAAGLLPVTILAPLAVHPEYQGRGLGYRLVNAGLARLKQQGVKLVFVLGHPGYYPRFGFQPAGRFGLEAPYPIPTENAEAWMVMQLQAGIPGHPKGRVRCAGSLNKPELWRD